jgi:hypothetical protein
VTWFRNFGYLAFCRKLLSGVEAIAVGRQKFATRVCDRSAHRQQLARLVSGEPGVNNFWITSEWLTNNRELRHADESCLLAA